MFFLELVGEDPLIVQPDRAPDLFRSDLSGPARQLRGLRVYEQSIADLLRQTCDAVFIEMPFLFEVGFVPFRLCLCAENRFSDQCIRRRCICGVYVCIFGSSSAAVKGPAFFDFRAVMTPFPAPSRAKVRSSVRITREGSKREVKEANLFLRRSRKVRSACSRLKWK